MTGETTPGELRTRSQRMCWPIFRPVRSPISGAEILFCCMMAVEIASKQFWHYRRLSRERVHAVSSLFLSIELLNKTKADVMPPLPANRAVGGAIELDRILAIRCGYQIHHLHFLPGRRADDWAIALSLERLRFTIAYATGCTAHRAGRNRGVQAESSGAYSRIQRREGDCTNGSFCARIPITLTCMSLSSTMVPKTGLWKLRAEFFSGRGIRESADFDQTQFRQSGCFELWTRTI